MSIWVVQKQMIVIFILILIGVFLYKKGHLTQNLTRQLSWIIVNVTNPITLLCAAFSVEPKVDAKHVGIAFLCFFVMYAILIPLAYLLPMILGVEKKSRYAYRMLAIFGNVGFIGIPVSSAVLGPESLIYVSLCGLTFNMIIYTYGVASLKETAALQHPDEKRENDFSLKNLVNSGTVLAVVTIIVYLTDVKIPDIAGSTLNYIGNCTTFLSMLVLGVSVAQMVPREVFTKWRLYVFVVIRQVLVPIAIVYLLRPFIADQLILRTVAIMASMPAANLPLMIAKQFGVDEEVISAGIILTTLVSIVTIPAVMFFV